VSKDVLDGSDLAADLIKLGKDTNSQGVVAPALMAARIMASKRSWAMVPFPVVVVPRDPVAALLAGATPPPPQPAEVGRWTVPVSRPRLLRRGHALTCPVQGAIHASSTLTCECSGQQDMVR